MHDPTFVNLHKLLTKKPRPYRDCSKQKVKQAIKENWEVKEKTILDEETKQYIVIKKIKRKKPVAEEQIPS